ncbi:efflux RND transporter permease subunit [Brevundimonas diminuta]|uniref:efflux RND transporter permease subunit n=1 Tax=Brevundimonas diminuta TaxID=293 RepID=UPI003D9A19D1
MTLFALILALGLLVDAAIVVIENIHRRYGTAGAGADKQAVTISATNEIGNATNLATFAVMLVFISMLVALTGMPRQYFLPVAITVPMAMAASVVVAYIVAPWAANRWVKLPTSSPSLLEDPADNPESAHGGHKPDWLQRVYLRLMGPLQARSRTRRAFACGAVVALLLSVAMGGWQFIRPAGVGGPVPPLGVAMGFLPKDNKNTFNVVIATAESSPVENTARLVGEINHLLAGHSQVVNYQSWIGRAGVADFNGMIQGSAWSMAGRSSDAPISIRSAIRSRSAPMCPARPNPIPLISRGSL